MDRWCIETDRNIGNSDCILKKRYKRKEGIDVG